MLSQADSLCARAAAISIRARTGLSWHAFRASLYSWSARNRTAAEARL